MVYSVSRILKVVIIIFSSDLGRNPSILSIVDGIVCICRGNGSLLHLSLAPFQEKLLKHVASNMWQEALQVNTKIIFYAVSNIIFIVFTKLQVF